MITEQDLQEAIAECQGVRNPTASTCIKLAAFYTIKEHLFPEAQPDLQILPPSRSYSYAAQPDQVETHIDYSSDTEFGQLISGKSPSAVWPLIDELVSEALQTVNPKLYDSFIRRLK